MSKEVAKYGARALRQVCMPVERVDAEVRALVDDLFESMHAADGVGLAAPQIGVPRRVIVVDVTHQEPQRPPIALINPRLASTTGSVVAEEGCLSFPDLYGDVKRFAAVEVEALGVDGEPVRIAADGFYARVLQHEMDHLEGKLFIDHLSPLKRQLLRGALKRLLKEGEAYDRRGVLG